MSNASVVWRSDDKEVIASLQKMEKRNEALIQQIKKLKSEGKASGDEMKSAFGGAMTGAIGLLGGIASVDGAFQLLINRAKELRAEGERLGKLGREVNQQSAVTAGGTGQLANVDWLNAQFKSVKGIHPSDVQRAYETAAKATPSSVLERQMELAKEAAKFAPTKTDVGQLGDVYGGLADLMPAKSAGDIADMTMRLKGVMGADFGELQAKPTQRAIAQLVQAKAVGSHEEAFAYAAAAHDANLKPAILEQLAVAAEKGIKPSQLAGNAALARRVLGDEAGLKFATIPQDQVVSNTKALFEAQQNDFAANELLGFRQSSIGAQSYREYGSRYKEYQDSESRWANQELYGGDLVATMQRAEPGAYTGGITRMLARMEYDQAVTRGGDPEQEAIRVLETAERKIGPRDYRTGQQTEYATKEQREASAYLKEQVELLRRIEANQNRRVLNVNAHSDR